MRMTRIAIVFMAMCLPRYGFADRLQVVVDIAPVHSLVAQVMDGVGEPHLLLPAAASPHDYALRPSDARSMQNADVIFWVGESLTPWLAETLEALSPEAAKFPLLDAEGTLRLDFRTNAVFAKADDDHDHSHDHESDEHDHAGVDPHAWLDPNNAKIWLSAIAAELSKIDPINVDQYGINLAAALLRIDGLVDDLTRDLAGIETLRFVMLHDGYHYFENRFGLKAVGAISESDAKSPGAGRVREIRRAIEREGVSCLFTEVQLQSPLIDAIANETKAKVVTIDPLGALATPGKDLYFENMKGIAAAFKSCL